MGITTAAESAGSKLPSPEYSAWTVFEPAASAAVESVATPFTSGAAAKSAPLLRNTTKPVGTDAWVAKETEKVTLAPTGAAARFDTMVNAGIARLTTWMAGSDVAAWLFASPE